MESGSAPRLILANGRLLGSSKGHYELVDRPELAEYRHVGYRPKADGRLDLPIDYPVGLECLPFRQNSASSAVKADVPIRLPRQLSRLPGVAFARAIS